MQSDLPQRLYHLLWFLGNGYQKGKSLPFWCLLFPFKAVLKGTSEKASYCMKVSPLLPFKAALTDPRGDGHYFPSWEPPGRWEALEKRKPQGVALKAWQGCFGKLRCAYLRCVMGVDVELVVDLSAQGTRGHEEIPGSPRDPFGQKLLPSQDPKPFTLGILKSQGDP